MLGRLWRANEEIAAQLDSIPYSAWMCPNIPKKLPEHINEIALDQSNNERIRIQCNLSIIAPFNNMNLEEELQSLKQAREDEGARERDEGLCGVPL